METKDYLTMAISFFSNLATSSPWGLAAVGIAVLSSMFGINAYIKKVNKNTDSKDQENAGADAGETATELQGQVREVANKLDELGKANQADDK